MRASESIGLTGSQDLFKIFQYFANDYLIRKIFFKIFWRGAARGGRLIIIKARAPWAPRSAEKFACDLWKISEIA